MTLQDAHQLAEHKMLSESSLFNEIEAAIARRTKKWMDGYREQVQRQSQSASIDIQHPVSVHVCFSSIKCTHRINNTSISLSIVEKFEKNSKNNDNFKIFFFIFELNLNFST